MSVVIQGMKGLGDNIYQRAFVRAMVAREAVYLTTPWPELYQDLPVHFVYAETPLRTQAKNIARQSADRWSFAPAGTPRIEVRYGHDSLAGGNILQAMERCLPLGTAALTMDLPCMVPGLKLPTDKPIALIRPVTVRSEWQNEARNPLPEYIAAISESLAGKYYRIVVADIENGREWLVGDLPPYDACYLHGELSVTDLLGLVGRAALCVGGVGWLVPACIATRTPMFCVLGGMGGHNAPEKITDPRLETQHIGWATPERFCLCTSFTHSCDKRIANVIDKFERWKDERILP
jgi:hypothetical protein